ncbi:MAG TPA: carboxy terminal-processing peptidase, partial [Roseimicrobium sp.]|nr:carboxy terminal-processing peptidase [Roseimicrobium sp.]
TPAYVIFKRFLQRLDQQHDYVQKMLSTEKFEFSSDEKYLLNRKDQSRPKTIAEAQKLWRDRLRFEYLQELLNQKSSTNVAASQLKFDPAIPKESPKQETTAKPGSKTSETVKKAPTDPRAEVVKLLEKRYNRIWRSFHEFDSGDVLQVYLAALTHSYDPHSDYMGKSELDNFSISMKLSLFGIGAQLTSEEGYCTIRELMAGGPAFKSNKLKPKDRIVAVAQGAAEPVDVIDMKLNKVVELIRGPKGTEVRLTVIPADATDSSARQIVSLVRDEIPLEEQEAKAKLIDTTDSQGRAVKLGVIDLPSFYADFDADDSKPADQRKSTTSDVAKLVRKLKEQKVSGIILDLRSNGGGSLEEAIRLTGLFIKEGPVVQVKDSSGRIIVDKDEDPSVLYDGPMIVLTSRFSASASEILAGALQDYGRAMIVGDVSTHGKGTVQTLLRLNQYIRPIPGEPEFDPGALKVTIRKFYRASGTSTQFEGVKPDVVLPSVNNFAEVGEASLENALAWDTIATASYKKVNLIQPILPEIQKRSSDRIKQDTDFKYVQEDIERFQRLLADKTVSMNELTRRQEKKELEEQLNVRKQERIARKAAPETLYEISLKQAVKPGLPEATDPKAKAKKNRPAPTSSDDDDEPQDPGVDVTMKEARRILIDLISLLPKNPVLAGSPNEVR